jgi:hypothetical protein
MQAHADSEKMKINYDAEAKDELSFNRYFRSNGRAKGRLLSWVLIHDIVPNINVDFKRMALNLFVKSTCDLVKIRVGSVIDFFDEVGRIIILSQLACYINEKVAKGKVCKFKLPLNMARYVSLAGDNPTHFSSSQLQ